MHLFKNKNQKTRDDELRETGNMSWKLQISTTSADRLENFINKVINKRSQSWCRACHSKNCQFDQVQQKVPSSGFDDNFREQLDTLKLKRVALEEYLGRVEKLNTSCRLGLLRQPYLPSQHQIPPWLAGVLESEISLPLIPTFPSTGNALKLLQDELGFVSVNNEILNEYVSAASCVRRVKIKAARRDVSPASSLIKLPVLSILEEVGDGSWKEESLLLHGLADLHSKSKEKFQENLPKSLKKVLKVTSDLAVTVEISQGGDTGRSRQLLENHLMWVTENQCENSSIEECRDERVLIIGEFHESHSQSGSGFPFKLLMFPQKSSKFGKIGIKGTFIRKSASSSYDLRWRYTVEVDMTHQCS